MNIISASRRTDIPAFYGEWFLNRIKEGYAEYYNPFNYAQKYRVSLKPDDVTAFVFWSKNFKPFLPVLKYIEKDYNFIFHFTITGLPRIFEPNIPDIEETIGTFQYLSTRYGKEKMLWRFDPIIVSNITPQSFIFETFEKLSENLANHTDRCYISFVNFYGKVKSNFEKLRASDNIIVHNPDIEQQRKIAKKINDIAKKYGITIYSCCNDKIVTDDIKKAHCVDAELIFKIFKINYKFPKINPTRKECGCYDSKDIGTYDTCPHNCIYCYANTNIKRIKRFYKKYNETTSNHYNPALFW